MVDNLLSVDERVGTNFRVTSDNGGPLEMRVVPPAGVIGPIDVTRVLFVDSGVGGAGASGAINQPYPTIAQAIAEAVASSAEQVIVKIAPGTYTEAIVIPTSLLTAISFDGWTSAEPRYADLPVLTGGMTVQPTASPPTSPDVYLSNLVMTGTLTGTPTTDLQVHMHNVRFGGIIGGALLNLYAVNSNIAGDVGGSDDTFLWLDGYSWGQLIFNGANMAPAAKQFFDHGCDVCPSSLNVTGLAIGASQDVQFPHPETLDNEWAIVTKTGVAQTDYQLVFSHTTTAAVHCILTNLSRVSTNFSDDVSTLVFHGTMPGFAPP
jgi:hypothetical protein